jgi:hypothetical protein
MNDDLRQVVQRLEQQGYSFSFDDQTPDHEVEEILDLVYAEGCGNLENVCDCCGASLSPDTTAAQSRPKRRIRKNEVVGQDKTSRRTKR